MSLSPAVMSQNSVEPGLVLWLPLQGDLLDYSGNGNKQTGIKTQWSNGKKSKAFLFDGTSYINCGNNPILRIITDFTISAILKINPSWGATIGIISEKTTGTNWEASNHYFRVNTDKTLSMIRGDGTVNYKIITTSFVLKPDIYYHIVAQSTKIYINGVSVSVSSAGTGTSYTGAPSYNFQLGASDSPNVFFNGTIENYKLYNRVLTDQEVWDLYQKYL